MTEIEIILPTLREHILIERGRFLENPKFEASLYEQTGYVTANLLTTLMKETNPLGVCVKFIRQGHLLVYGYPDLNFITIAAIRGLHYPDDAGVLQKLIWEDSIGIAGGIDTSLGILPYNENRALSVELIEKIAEKVEDVKVEDRTYWPPGTR